MGSAVGCFLGKPQSLLQERHGLIVTSHGLGAFGGHHQAVAVIDDGLLVGPGPGGQLAAHGQRLEVSVQGLVLRPDRVQQATELVVRPTQRLARLFVGLVLEQTEQLVVVLLRVAQQPLAQLLELGLLQQDVLADAGVELADRLHRQVEPGGHALAAWSSAWPGPERRRFVRRAQVAVGPGLDPGDGAQPGQRHHQHGRRGRHQRPVPPQPPPRPPRERLAPGGHRLIRLPPLHVLGQRRGVA